MKRSSFVINASRGQIVQEDALYKALVEGRIAGAGLSVFSEEPLTPNSKFYKLGDSLPNVVLFPHMGVGKNTGTVMAHTAIDDVIAVLEGRQPRYLLNKELAGLFKG